MSVLTPDELSVALSHFATKPGSVLVALQDVQARFGYVPDWALDVVAKVCNVSRAEVYGVFTFYSDLRKTAPAKVVGKVCVAEACQANGSRALADDLHNLGYDVHKGAIKDDIAFEQTFCLGNCALGPAALVNGEPVARATAARLLEVAREHLADGEGNN